MRLNEQKFKFYCSNNWRNKVYINKNVYDDLNSTVVTTEEKGWYTWNSFTIYLNSTVVTTEEGPSVSKGDI